MRLAKPDLNQSNQIHQAGVGLLNLFAGDLFSAINAHLVASQGIDWLTNYRKSKMSYLNYNFVDPSNLLKEIIRESNSPLRVPIRERIPQKEMVSFFKRLEIILDDRNDWVHHNYAFHAESLKTLILNIYPVCEKMSLDSIKECDYLLSLLAGIDSDVAQFDMQSIKEEEPSIVVSELKNLIPENEPTIGSLVDDLLLEFSYVLHLNGEIRDRKTNETLSTFSPESAQFLAALLIARKPSGGRLRITQSGILVAYFEDHWGYLAKVNSEIWFPNQLFFSV